MRHKSIIGAALVFWLAIAGIQAGDIGFGLPDFNASGSSSTPFSLGEKPLLRVSILPETSVIAPGVPFRLLLELDHAPGAYTYWTNPGGPGLGTEVEWTLPDGFAVSPPEWPTPELLLKAGITSYINKGKAAAVYTVIPPNNLPPGEKIDLAAAIDAQVCTAKSCIPTKASAKTTLTAAEKPAPAASATLAAFARATARLPGPAKGWTFSAGAEGGDIVLSMRPEAGALRELKDVYFFESGTPGGLIDSQKPQTLERGEDGAWRLRLPRAPDSAETPILAGVAYSATGWSEGASAPSAFALEMPIAVPEQGVAAFAEPADGIAALLLFAFLGGLILNVMPCVFPVIGLKIMGFARQAHQNRGEMFRHGLYYAAGVLLSFWTLALFVVGVGKGWGAQLQSPWFLFTLCYLFLILAMNMAGVFDVGLSLSGAGQSLASGKGFKRSFFTGLLATVIATPCSAPFLGTALAYALSLPPLLSLGVFTLMGIGFSFPYLILSLFPGLLKKLPKPGPWMDSFRQALSFPLFASVMYLAWTMEAMLAEWRFLMLLLGLVGVAMACWLYGRSQKTGERSRRAAWVWKGFAVFALAVGVWMGVPKSEVMIRWDEWSPETVSRLRGEGRTVYVDFTARWCATCQVNKRVWQDANLAALLAAKNVVMLKADWTLHDERITRTLKNEFGRAAVPVNVVYLPGVREGVLLPELLTAGDVAEALKALPDL